MLKKHFLQRIFVSIMAFLVVVSSASSVYALDSKTEDYYAKIGVSFYDPDGGCNSSSGSSSTVTVLPGNNTKEKIWNWFASAGLVGVSDNANVIAAIMGNLVVESGLRPFAINGSYESGCIGLYQACGGRREKVKNAFRQAGIDESYWRNPNNVPDDIIDKAIDATLKLMTTGEDSSTFREFVSYLGRVSENTPQAYSDLFLAIVERAYASQGHGTPLLERAAIDYVLNDGLGYTDPNYYQGAEQRRNNAVTLYNELSGSTSSSGAVTSIRSDTQSMECSGSSSVIPGELVEGGMTYEQAVEFTRTYREIRPRNYHEPGGQILSTWSINNTGCWSDLENCVAFTQWFICQYANVCMPLPDGGEVVGRLLSSPYGFINGGSTPRPYAVFSHSGHTGVVLGIFGNTVITGEAACSFYDDGTPKNTYDYSGAHNFRTVTEMTGHGYTYAYTDDLIRFP